ncbi:hypothetical protein CK203_030992 [Vitis vinifera]|uniref:Uncharacterized protein n=1 Tax=Vitis vinifera TaxID=29760 RepID=A0A438I1A7_VITVI|nr:hypothetical protein CK203_030992 [Vitis vinifera]
MPIYLMSLMRIPRVVRLRLEKIQRDFLWGGVRWRRGLILALLCKWSWRFAAERESFWKLIISRKYGEEGGWISREVRKAMGWGCGISQDAVGSELLGFYGGWYPCFSRPFNDWEIEAVASLLSLLQGKRLIVGWRRIKCCGMLLRMGFLCKIPLQYS